MSVFDRFFKTFLLIFLPMLLFVNLVLTTGLAEHLTYLLTGGFNAIEYNPNTIFGFNSIIQALESMPEFRPITHVVNSVYQPINNIVSEISKIATLDISADPFMLFAHIIFLPIEMLGYASIALLEVLYDIVNLGRWVSEILMGYYNEPMVSDPYAQWYNTNLI